MLQNSLVVVHNSLNMIKIDRHVSEFGQGQCEKYNFNIMVFVGFIV